MGFADALKARAKRTKPWASAEEVPWREARYVVVDVETTGLDLGKDEIISIGAVEVIDGRVSSEHFYRVVHTERPISADAIRIHCLTQEDLVGAPAVGDVLAELRELVSGAAIVAHAAWVERAFLNRQLRMVGERVPDQLVDTAALARALDLAPVGRQEPSLEGLAKRLNLPVYTPHHALMDAITTAVLFLALAHRVEAAQSDPLTLDGLLGLSQRHGN